MSKTRKAEIENEPWNKNKAIGQMVPFTPDQAAVIRTLLGTEKKLRDLALFNTAIDTMLRHLDKQLPRQEFIDGVVVEFFGPGQHVSSRLTSKYAIRYETEGRVIVRDSVVWQTINDEILETEELIWDEKEKKVYTNKFVTIQRPDEIIYGHGFEANEDFTHSKIKAVEGKIKIDDINNDLKD